MKNRIFVSLISVLLCSAVLFMSSCDADLGISTDEQTDASVPKSGIAGIGAATGAYNGLFDSIAEIRLTVGEAEFATVLDHADSGMYCECDAEINGVPVSDIGIKARGNTAYVTEYGNGRYSLKLKFNKYMKGQKYNGLDELDLNNVSYDPSYIREYLAYALFSLSSGSPAPLCTFAKLYINGEYYGLYTAVESVDSSFLKRVFGDNDGDLYEAGKASAFITDDTSTFELKKGSDTSLAGIVSLYNALGTEGIEDVLDVGSVLRYTAITSLICATESYIGPKAENYYLYRAADGKFRIIPSDMKISFGTDGELKKSEYDIDESLTGTSVTEPYFTGSAADRPLISSLLENDEYKALYLTYVKYYNDALSSALSSLSELKAEIDQSVNDDPRRFFDIVSYDAEYTDKDNTLYGFIKSRCEEVSSQLMTTGE